MTPGHTLPINKKRVAVVLKEERNNLSFEKQHAVHNLQLLPLKELLKQQGVKTSGNSIFLTPYMVGDIYDNLARFHYKKSDSLRRRELKERVSIIKQLKRLGFNVAAIHYRDTISKETAKRHLGGSAKLIEGKPPTYVHIGESRPVNQAFWARDLWTKFEGRRIKHFSSGGTNPFGEGARFVSIPGTRSYIVNSSLEKAPEIAELSRKGYKFYFVSNGFSLEPWYSKSYRKKIYESSDHTDMFVGAVGKVLLCDYDYFRLNRNILRSVAADQKLEIVYVPGEEKHLIPQNFFLLGENSVLVDRSAKKTIALLRSKGVEVVETDVSLVASRNSGGGLHCIINEL